MKNRTILLHAAIFAVPLGIFLILAPYSLLLGWNLLTSLLFWFILVPVLALYLPMIFLKKGLRVTPSLTGLVLFYGFMIFMIYDHFDTDLFTVMMASAVFNLALITAIGLSRRVLFMEV
jgi:hypothetical protein